MWKIVYLGVLFILVLIVFTSNGLIGKMKDRDNVIKYLHHLLNIALISILFNGLFIISTTEITGLISHSIFTSTIDWLLMFFVLYVMEYTGFNKYKRLFVPPMLFMAILGSISACANIFFHNQFNVVIEYVPGFGQCARPVNYTSLYSAHLHYSYVLVGFAVFILVHRLMTSARVYRTKYFAVLASLVVCTAIDGVGLIMRLPIDLSLISYCLVCILLCYFTIIYVPNDLIQSSLINAVGRFDVGVACFDENHHCIYINEMGKSIFNRFDKTKVINGDLTPIENYCRKWFEENWTEDDKRGKVVFKDIKDSYRSYNFEVSACKLYDKKDNEIGYYITITDRTEEVEKYNLEHYKATHDPLTGLYNAEYFFEKVEEALLNNPKQYYVMITSDIKNFKLINDMLGYETGDELLKMHAKEMQKYAKEDDIYGRIGVDQFAFFMPRVRFQSRDFLKTIDYLKDQFSNQFFRVQIYMGVYEIVDRFEPVFAMCDKCNMAINSIKGDYTNKIAYYNDQVMENELTNNAIINGFGSALDNGDLKMFLQAQTDTSGRMIGAEALVRWVDSENGGMRFPASFIGVLEKARLIHLLDTFMWEEACKKLAEWKERGLEDLYISVNISVEDQYYIDIYRTIRNLVEKYKINPKNLKLEITESIFATNMAKHMKMVNDLRNYGFDIEIDDFGSGYSSLTVLKDIRADVLKLDMEFLRHISDVNRTRNILKSTIQIAKDLEMKVVSEGVETEDQFNMMRDLDCDLFQGYYFSKPIPVEDFEEKYLS